MSTQPGPQGSAKDLRVAQARLAAQIKRKKAHFELQQRKQDTRRKVLVGAIVLELMKEDAELRHKVQAAISKAIYRPIDKKAFSSHSGWQRIFQE